MLRDILGFSADDESTPVTSEMITQLTDILAESTDGSYDVDEVLLTLTLAVIGLETRIIESSSETRQLKAYVLELETRILEAGLPLSDPD